MGYGTFKQALQHMQVLSVFWILLFYVLYSDFGLLVVLWFIVLGSIQDDGWQGVQQGQYPSQGRQGPDSVMSFWNVLILAFSQKTQIIFIRRYTD